MTKLLTRNGWCEKYSVALLPPYSPRSYRLTRDLLSQRASGSQSTCNAYCSLNAVPSLRRSGKLHSGQIKLPVGERLFFSVASLRIISQQRA
jgi:hypothetical protein